MKIAIIGCGDVGRCYATALAKAGHQISDLCDSRPNTKIEQYARELDAALHTDAGPWLSEVDLVITSVLGEAALAVASKALPHMHKGSVYADFTTGNPADLRAAEQLASKAGIGFVDVAIMGTIELGGPKTPLLCAGPAFEQLIDVMASIGAPTRVVGTKAGDAVALKLLRSVFTKGLEAMAVECLMAAEKRGLRHELYDVLSDLDQSPIRDFMETVVTTHVRHAGRRLREVQEARIQLQGDGIHPLAVDGVTALFQRTSEAIRKSPLQEDPTIENSLKWLFDHQ